MAFVLLVASIIGSILLFNLSLTMIRAADTVEFSAGGLFLLLLGLGWGWAIVRYVERRKIMGLLILMLASYSAACTTIEPGYGGIVVNMYGGNRGVADYVVKTGRVTYNPWSEDVFQYPCFKQTGRWSAADGEGGQITFNDKDGMSVGVNVSWSYQLKCEKIPAFYVEFRSDDISNFSNGYLRNAAQEFFNAESAKRSAEEIYSSGKEQWMAEIKRRTNEKLSALGIELDQFSVYGEMSLPQAIKTSIENKQTAIQNAIRVENELRQTKADAAKKIAEAEGEANSAIAKAKGQSEANRIINESISAGLLEWRRLTIQEQQAQRWNGTLPTTMLGGSGIVPMINVPQK